MAPLAARLALAGGLMGVLCVGTWMSPEPGVGWLRVIVLAPFAVGIVARPMAVHADVGGLEVRAPLRTRTYAWTEIDRIEVVRRGFPFKARQLCVHRSGGDLAVIGAWSLLHGWGRQQRARRLEADLQSWVAWERGATSPPASVLLDRPSSRSVSADHGSD